MRPSTRSGSGGSGSGGGGAGGGAYGQSSSRLQCANPGVRSESPPPGVPLQRKGGAGDDDWSGGIESAGASWASHGGSGFKGQANGAGAAASGGKKGVAKISREDFPGLPGEGGGGSSSSAVGLGLGGGGGGRADMFAAGQRPLIVSARPPGQQQQRKQRAPTANDFPGLPMPAAAMPGMGKVDWGGGAGSGGGGARGGVGLTGSAESVGGSGGGGGGGGGGKGAKKKNRQKAEKDALKGMAFGFR